MTELLYLQDFDVETCPAKVLSVSTSSDDVSIKTDIILDRTCFYPRGGGQDWDTGVITTGDTVAQVDEVRLDEQGLVHHLCTQTGEIKVGDEVSCAVDHERRLINTRLHSAGHMIDMAVDNLGFTWKPTKGQHYPHLSAVEYKGDLGDVDIEILRQDIEARANELQHQEKDNSLAFMNMEELHIICRHVPEFIPKNKPCRVMIYGENFGVPCGGTHVRKLTDIGHVHVPKVKCKNGIIRVNYTVEGIN
ncbi:MAG: alanine--tRNA ligase-related protein [Candidatus Saccharimonas sp.]